MEDEKKLGYISRAFALGMRYIQKGIKYREKDPAKSQRNIEKFYELCDTAETDIAMASAKPRECAYMLLQTVNADRNRVLQALMSCENAHADAQIISSLRGLAHGLSVTYGQVLSAIREKGELPTIVSKSIPIVTIVTHDEIASDILQISISQFIGPTKGVISYMIKIKRGENVEAVLKDITPGNVNLSAMITGMNPTDERKRNRLLRGELVFEIWAIKKKLIRGTEEKLCCKFGVKMNSWAKECVYEKTTVVPYKDKKQFTVSVTGIMRQPLQGACVKKETLVVHLSTTAPLVASAPRATAPAPAPAPRASAGAASPAPRAAAPRATAPAAAPARNTAPKAAPAPPPKAGPPALYILKDWEWERFISGEVLVDLKKKVGLGCETCKKRGVEVPETFIEQGKKIEERLATLQANCGGGKWTPEMYMGLVRKQIDEDKKKLQEITDRETRANFNARLVMMQNELEEMEAGDEDE